MPISLFTTYQTFDIKYS